MLEFEKEVIFTGMTERTSKKTESKYILVNFLGETGETFSAMSEGVTRDRFESLKQLDTVLAKFSLNKYGNNLNIKVLDILKV